MATPWPNDGSFSMIDPEFVVEEPTSHSSHDDLTRELVAHNESVWGDPKYTTVGFYRRDSAGNLEAGLSARFRWGWLFIEMLWVAAPLRGQGVGGRLLEAAESFARARDGVAVHLESGGERALPFYRRHGYEVVGAVEGFPPGTRHHILRKWLQSPPHPERRDPKEA
jgi:GNAT superfamily N-acetyltransferase